MLTCSHPHRAYMPIGHKPGVRSYLVWNPYEAEQLFGRDAQGKPLWKVVYIPCGHCVACRLSKAREWATRCYHEYQTNPTAAFLTLTYNDEHLPADKCVSVRTHQLFMKRLRKALPGHKIRFFMCAEYGKKGTLRPHYHYIIFGYEFPDKHPWKNSHTGHCMYRSDLLERIWTFGYSTVQRVTFETCQYVARYVLKKAHGSIGDKWYEEHHRTPEFCRASNRPGIGSDWFHKYYVSDVRGRDRVPVMTDKGIKQFALPRYYVKIMEREWHDDFIEYKTRQFAQLELREQKDRLEAERQGIGYADWCKFQLDQALLSARNKWKGNYRSFENKELTPNEEPDIMLAIDERLKACQPELFIGL